MTKKKGRYEMEEQKAKAPDRVSEMAKRIWDLPEREGLLNEHWPEDEMDEEEIVKAFEFIVDELLSTAKRSGIQVPEDAEDDVGAALIDMLYDGL